MAAKGIRRGERLGVGENQILMTEPFWLFCAGEDSGDILGESVVKEIVGKGFRAVGSGGVRMRNAGLCEVLPFDDLPVNGFWDVLLHLRKLGRAYSKLAELLKDENCRGFVAVDYPGFGIRLMKLALSMKKRVVYVAPPQIWAWKPGRIRNFLTPDAREFVEIRAIFDVECEAYRKFGLNVSQVPHPFDFVAKGDCPFSEREGALLFPGSRIAQIRRNGKLYAEIAYKLKERIPVCFVASRNSTREFLEKKLRGNFPVLLSPENALERFRMLSRAKFVVACPGTTVVEAFKAKTFCVAASRVDPLTFILGKNFLRTKFVTIPNIERDIRGERPVIPEIVRSSLSDCRLHAESVICALDGKIP